MPVPFARRAAALLLTLPPALLAPSAPAWADPAPAAGPVWEYEGSYGGVLGPDGLQVCDRVGREGVEAGEWTDYRCSRLIVGPPHIVTLYVLR
ncbi:hypothetical protein [Nocardiopsis changdeensis]|uniref:hypothetical protein n=1 Tax=Nocardiopsis changdeensis TaxID=2831969 RepID=UPI003F482687